MTIQVFHSLQTIAKWLTLLAIGLLLWLGLMQNPAQAAAQNVAEPGVAPGITEPVAGKNIDEIRKQHNEWQSRASALHDQRDSEDKSLGEVVKEKLNLDEITEGYDPERETEKAYQRDPLGSR